ncbi:hypothetical protein PIIN_00080 [Serendipita indica DSM 11827]|uniref:Xylanolytic transcriptional activator regulatory domain-containing protein n=1 Tax=Serendipita indica (strain DSM 11827) TaxID=1109443 RepID=G4T538_SERID|nr:hypothetical protein PIIN_00080 [Serendipita indica DSM 11827]
MQWISSKIQCTWTADEDSRRPATKQYVESLKNTNKVQQERIQRLEALLAANGISADGGTAAQPGASQPAVLLPGSSGPRSQTHSPSGSWTGDLPPDTFLAPGNDPGYDSLSDTESVAENLSNAASRLVINDGDLAVVGPSSLQFHRPSPITRTIPLEDDSRDAPKHTLHIGEDVPHSRSHSRNPSFNHNRSRSHSQARSVGHSRSSSVAPHGLTPPSQVSNFAGNVSPPAGAGLFANLSPPPGSASVGYFDPASPGSDQTGQEPSTIDHIFSASNPRGAFSPNAVADDDDDDHYDWRLVLPKDIDISRTEHDTVLDTFFKFFSSWCYRTIPDLFLRDMRRYLENSQVLEKSQNLEDEKATVTGPKTVHYTPMLHNAILSIALAYSEDPMLSSRSTRAKFVQQAKSTLEIECSRPSLACVQALAYIASFYSGEGEQTLGFLYFGMSIRMSQALGLSIDCSGWVRSGHISALDEVDRVWTYWVTYSLDKCWAFYVGRDHGLPNPLLRASQPPTDPTSATSQTFLAPPSSAGLRSPVPTFDIHYPLPDERADNQPWEWKSPQSWGSGLLQQRKSSPNSPSNVSSAFYQTSKLMVLATKVMNAIWRLPKNASSESIASLALDVDSWLEELPDSMRITRPKTTQALPHILMINMAHQWIQIVLHRPFYRLSQNKADPSIKRCDSGAEKILQYLAAWRRLYELRYVPITAVQIAFVAGTTCLLRAIQSVNMPEKRRTALDGVREIIRALNEMGRTWKSAKQSADALKVLLHEQVSVNERSPGPTRHPTVELQPPSVANSRAGTMDMAFEIHSGSRMPLGGRILEEVRFMHEPHPDLAMGDSLFPGGSFTADSPGSSHSGQYFNTGDGMGIHNAGYDATGQGHFAAENALGLPGLNMQPGVLSLGGQNPGLTNYGFPQFGQFMDANQARLRGGESFPNHPIGQFGATGGHGASASLGNTAEWFSSEFSYSGVGPQQSNQQFWGQ